MRHRGPDDEGFYLGAGVGLGMRRLSIIDVQGGRQPLSDETGRIRAVVNGEIYNYRDLRKETEAAGHRYATRSDAEVVVHLYEEHGERFVERLRGMFALAVWDGSRCRLLLARDRLGKKPLFYAERGGRLAFASSLWALLQDDRIPRVVDRAALAQYLTYQYVPGPRAILEGVKKLPPASLLVWENGTVRVEGYWRLPAGEMPDRPEAAWGEELLARLREATRVRLESEVPLGAFLSGGIDSSAVVALMAEVSSRPVQTFTVGFEEEGFSEAAEARLVARHLGTDHHECVVHADAAAILPELVRHYGEPFADASALPSYYVAREARRHVTVALNGDGGDELFAGYDRYRWARLAERYARAPQWIRSAGASLVARLTLTRSAFRPLRRAARFLSLGGLSPEERYLRLVAFFDPDQLRDVLRPEFLPMNGDAPIEVLREAFRSARSADSIGRLLEVDLATYLPDDLLVKMDVATMAHSLEARSPFLDHQLVEWCARMPRRYKLRGGRSKTLLRRVMAPLLPRAILERPKHGFAVPVSRWLRTDLREFARRLLAEDARGIREFFSVDAVSRLVEEHLDGRLDHGARLWALINFDLWHRCFIEGEAI